ncbi:alpha/beta hydrolase [Aliinostoc sp. HNIBRCY26]|uniref:alpha/beta hydrolase n=1 Tax=Aliinostoc sp. HNIBRCY26 TaxID=3418997 RepID=UPI003D06F5B0
MGRRGKNLSLIAGCLSALTLSQFFGLNTSAQAADTVVVRYGLFAESVSLADLQTAATTGEFPRSLDWLTKRLSQEQRRSLLGTLKMRVPLNVVTLSRLLNTQIGTTILNDISTALARKDKAGANALRAALVLGANSPQGLSVLSFIAAYPSQRLEINLPQAVTVMGSLNNDFWRTQQLMLSLSPQLAPQASQINLPFDPSLPGKANVQVENWNLNDQKRDRKIPVDIYWSTAAESNKPLIVFTHGLGSVRTELRYLAEHLASHGYIVAAIEHPGSNQNHVDLAFKGKTRIVEPQEFLDRPQDISFVLDEFTKYNQTAKTPLAGRIATDNVMVVGYSFGGATALALAGGEFQIAGLKQTCRNQLASLSVGTTIQCIAQELPENSYQLRDNRVKQVMALSPTTSRIFGETGLTKVQVPTLILASSADKSTPALTEQVIGFSKISAPKWLAGVIGGTHLSVKDPSTTLDQADQPNTALSGGEIVGEQAADVRKFVKAIALAMAAQLTPEADTYQVFLTPDYAQAASTPVFPFRIVRDIPPGLISMEK